MQARICEGEHNETSTIEGWVRLHIDSTKAPFFQTQTLVTPDQYYPSSSPVIKKPFKMTFQLRATQ